MCFIKWEWVGGKVGVFGVPQVDAVEHNGSADATGGSGKG